MEYLSKSDRELHLSMGWAGAKIRVVLGPEEISLVAADVCNALDITMHAVRTMPSGLRGKCSQPDTRRRLDTVSISGALWLNMKSRVFYALTMGERIPLTYIDTQGNDLGREFITNTHEGVLRGLSEALAATHKVNRAHKIAERAAFYAAIQVPCEKPQEHNDQNLSEGI